MSTFKQSEQARRLYRIVQEIADSFDREAPLTQILAYLRVAAEGDMGMDQGKLQDEIMSSSAGISRTIQALGPTHYLKDRPGYDVVSREFDPVDNRKRSLKLTAKGERTLDRLIKTLEEKR